MKLFAFGQSLLSVRLTTAATLLACVAPIALAQNQTAPVAPSVGAPATIAPGYVNPFTDPRRYETSQTPEEIKAEAEHSKLASSLADQGNAAVGKGKLADAITLFRQSLDTNPAFYNTEARIGLGNALAEQGNFAPALAAYESLWYTDGGGKHFSGDGRSDSAVVLIRYAFLLRQAGRFSDALTAFQRAMQNHYLIDGIAHVSLTQNVSISAKDVPTEEFDKVAYLALGVGLARNYRRDEAVPYLLKAANLNSGNGLPYLYLAAALEGAKPETREKYGNPRAAYEKAAALGGAEVRVQAKLWLKRHGVQ